MSSLARSLTKLTLILDLPTIFFNESIILEIRTQTLKQVEKTCKYIECHVKSDLVEHTLHAPCAT